MSLVRNKTKPEVERPAPVDLAENQEHGQSRTAALGTRVDPFAVTRGDGADHQPEALPAAVQPVEGDGIRREPWRTRWGRRAITLPALFVVTALVLAISPLALVVAVVGDIVKRQPWYWTRFVAIVNITTLGHLLGLVGLVAVWVGSGKAFGRGGQRWLAWNRGLEVIWSNMMVRAAMVIYQMGCDIEGAEVAAKGPILVCSRHASVVDTLLPAAILGMRHRMFMRIVKKYELLYDVCVDIVSHRLHRAFVKRGGKGQLMTQLAAIRSMTAGMDHDDAAVIFPEGTRFTARKKQRVVAALERRQPAMAIRARQLKHLLPVRTAGTFAVLDAQPNLDVVFMAHTGLEGASRLEHFVNGVLYRRTLRVKFWRVSAGDIPNDEQQRTDWLCNQWQRMDDWIDRNRSLT